MKRVMILSIIMFLVTTALIASPVQVSAQPKTFQLKFASPQSPQHKSAKLWDWWAQELDKRTAGRLKVTNYHAGSLGAGPEIWENILKGVADVGAIGNYTPGKHPVENELIQSLPFRIPNPHVTGDIFWKLYYKGLLNQEIGDYKFLWTQPTELYSLCTTKKKLTKADDFKGLRIRVPGVSPTLKAFGVGVVAMPVPELYAAVERGVVDGFLGGVTIIQAAKLEKLIKYINMESFGVGNWYICMNKNAWKSLPPEIQIVVEALNLEMYYKNLEEVHESLAAIIATSKKAGAEFYYADPAEKKRWMDLTSNLFSDWTASMDAKGLPGKQIKQETLQVLEEHGVDPRIH